MSEEIKTDKKIWPSVRRYFVAVGLFLLEFIKVAVLAGITIALVRYFLFKPFYVKGASMEPNFYDHEYLIIDELTYRFSPPARGDVIVFRYPNNPKEYFLKRIIGLPGERVKITEGHATIYNEKNPEGKVLTEPYLANTVLTEGDETVVLGNSQYFVMGDNRPNSYDSRRFGSVDKSYLVGRAWLRGWPFNRLEIFKTPNLEI